MLGAGPLWFVEVLLIFSLVYMLWRLLFRPQAPAPAAEPQDKFPGNAAIILFAFLLGVAGFLVRLVFPMDEYLFQPLNLQFGFFAQYIALFVVGLIAYRRNWLLNLPDKAGRLWLGTAALLILLGLGMQGAMATGALSKGGWHWQSLVYALWESFMCTSMCIGLIYLFRRYLNRRGKLAGFLVPNAYTAYIIHALVNHDRGDVCSRPASSVLAAQVSCSRAGGPLALFWAEQLDPQDTLCCTRVVSIGRHPDQRAV